MTAGPIEPSIPVSETVEEIPTRPEPSLIVPLVMGFGAVLAISIGGTLAGSPYDVHLRGAWTFGMGRLPVGIRNIGEAGVFAGMAVLLFAWYRIITYFRRRPTTPLRAVLGVFGVWVVPLLIAPPLFSEDAYSYVAQGTMVADGINPYHNGPAALAPVDVQVVNLVDPIWRSTPVPYGPLFLGFEAAAVKSAGHREAGAVEELRILAVAGVLLAAAAIPSLARRWGMSPSLAAALLVLSPLTLLGLISPGHNDALMAGLILAAMALSERGRPALAVGVCALAAAVKAPALIATAFVFWQWAGAQASWRARLRVTGITIAITLAVLETLALVTTVGWGWISTLGTPGLVHSLLTPTTDVALLGERFVHFIGFGPATSALLAATRVVGYLIAGVITVWLLRRSKAQGVLLALALSLLVFVALGPVFQPWYLAWGLFCLAPVATGQWQVLLIGVTTFATVASLPRFEPLIASTGWAGDLFGLAALLALAALASPRLTDRVSRLPFLSSLRAVGSGG
jgi:alpha-1,6-mannosyltransferase